MPSREGFYSGGAQAGLHGAFEGLGDYFARLQNERFKDRQSRRELDRAETLKRFNEATAKVQAGELTPEEAAAFTGGGAKPQHFAAMVPAPETMMAKLNSLLKPDTTDEEATVQMHSLAPFRKVPSVQTESPFAEPGSLEYESPVAAQVAHLLQAKRGEAEANTPVTKIGETASVSPSFGQQATETETGGLPEQPLGGDVQNLSIFGRYNRRRGGMEEVGRIPSGPSAVQKGLATGAEETAAAPGKGRAQVTIENTLRPAKIETERASQQSHIDTETSAANTAKEAYNKSTIEYATTRARDRAMQAGVNPQIANTFLRATATGRPYVNIPTGTPKEVSQVAMNELAKVPGVRFVNPQQEAALTAIDTARANYQNVVELIMRHAAKDFGGNLLQAPKNWLAATVKADPDLGAAISAFPQQIQALRAVAGQFGRITQQEIFRALNSFPSITDPGNLIVSKRGLFYNSLENAENGILGGKSPATATAPMQPVASHR